jgi:ParB family chromosome partitioning protein
MACGKQFVGEALAGRERHMSKSKPRLGRGLSSLISVSDPGEDLVEAPSMLAVDPAELRRHSTLDSAPGGGVMEVPLDQIRPNPHQPRREFNDASLAELASSLRTNGLLQPVVVRPAADGYELIAGERRLRAAKLAGLATIPAIVREVDGLTQAQLALVENIQREDLNPVDRARAYKSLLEQLGLSHAELATRLGEERSTVTNHLRLLELAAPVLELLRAAMLSMGHGKVLAGVADILEQERLAHLTVEKGLSVRSLEELVKQPAKPSPAKPSPSNHIRVLEKRISGQLGMRVNLLAKQNGSGKFTVHFANLDQFDDLMDKLGVKTDDND